MTAAAQNRLVFAAAFASVVNVIIVPILSLHARPAHGPAKNEYGKSPLIRGDHALHPEDGGYCRRCQHLARRTDRDHLAPVHDGDAVTEHGGVIEVVQRRHNGQALSAYQIEQADLVTYVEMVGRLVQEQDMRLLRQRAGDMQALPFAAGKMVPAALRLISHIHIGECCVNDGVILLRPGGKRPEVGRAPKLHGLSCGDAFGGFSLLLNEGEPAGKVSPSQRGKRFISERNVTPARLANACQHGEQRAFAGTVRSDDTEKLTGTDIE